ncbi:MAG: PD40 domain-containing protein [Verrucomicrobia bacterium]|nr:PD40 domain-containing protein [Verrucomicrobiota bacterium]
MNADPNARDKMLNDLGSTMSPASEAIADTPLAPPVIPDHELIRRIGRGSYGEVWLARNALGTWRAVKIVHRAAFDHDRPYEREFEGIRRFEPISRTHPSQLNVLHVGRNDAAGHFYYVMELADAAERSDGVMECRSDGQRASAQDSTTPTLQYSSSYSPRTLRSDLLQRGCLPFDECLQIGLAPATALDHLHRHGLVHRDIKPSNIVFVNGIPKLADIGLVAQAEATLSLVGTEGYLPPEGPGTAQADIFSLGKVLYEMATGRDRQEYPELPTNLIAQPAAERAQLAELNEIIVRACHADLKQRYQTAAELHADLALLQSGKSVSRMRTVERRVRTLARAGALVTALAVLAASAWLWQQKQTREARRLAAENARLAEENRQRIVRLDVANGVRLLDDGDPAGALLWFADALPLVTNNSAEETIHRIRIQQTLNQMPRPAQVLVHEHPVRSMAFSPDGKRLAIGTEWGWVHLWDVQTGEPLWKPLRLESDGIPQMSFTSDGRRLCVDTLYGGGVSPSERIRTTSAAVIDVATGQRLFTKVATNLALAALIGDGRWLVTAESDYVIRVLDVRDGSQVAALKGHTNNILAFSTSTDGNLLASTSEDGTIRLWRLPSGEPVGAPLPFQLEQHFPALSPDGQRLAIREEIVRDGVTNDFIRIWSTETLTSVGKPIEASGASGAFWIDQVPSRRLFSSFGGQMRVFDLDTQAELLPAIRLDKPHGTWAATQDSRRVMFGGRDRIDGLWSLETGEMLAPPFRHGRQILDIALSPDGSQLATITDEGACVLWKLNLRREDAVHRFNANIPGIRRGSPQRLLKGFSPDRRRFLIPLDDETVRLVDVERLAEVNLPGTKPTNCAPHQWTFSADNHQWAIAYAPTNKLESSVVELWRDEGGKLRRQMLPHAKEIQNTGFAPRSAIVEMWYDENGAGRFPWHLHPQKIRNMRFATGSASLITVSGDRQIRSWRTDDGALEHSVTAPETIDESGDLFPDGRTIFIVHRDIGFALFDLVTGSITPTPIGPGTVTAFAFDPAGERFATVTAEQWGRVWSTKTGAPLSPPVRHDGALTWVDWSPDGKRIAMAGVTPEVRVWEASTGELSLPPLRIGDKPLGTVMWSLDGRFIVARSGENVVRVWDSTTGEAVTPLLKHNGDVRLAHLVANNRLITLSLPNKLRAWDLKESRLAPDVLADYAKLTSGRRLNASGVLLPLKPDELAELCRSLRARAPQLFE